MGIEKTKMFAILKNNLVIDVGFALNAEDIENEIKDVKAIEMTLENSPAGIGYFYDGNSFIKEEQNV